MSLEKALAENTAALTAHTAAVQAQTEFLKSMAGSKGATTTTAAAATTPKGSTKAATPKVKTMEDVRTAASAYLGVADAEQRTANKANMKAILDHFGVDRATAISEEQIPEMLKHLETLQAGGTPDFMNEGEGEMV